MCRRLLLILLSVFALSLAAPVDASAEQYEQSCSQLGHPGCTYTVLCDTADSGCIVGGATCDSYCSDPWGGFGDPGQETQDCPVVSERPDCCAAEQYDCEIECSLHGFSQRQLDNCKQGCNAEYWGCRYDGVFAD